MQKKWKAKAHVILVLVVVSSLMAGLAGAAMAQTTLVWWTHQRHDMDFMQELVKEFNDTNTYGIKIEYNIMAENYRQNLELAFQSRQAPDIFSVASDTRYLADRNMALPLNTYLNEDMQVRFAGLLEVDHINSYNGHLYSLPNVGNPYRLIYNKDLFAKAGITSPPTNLEEMVEYAKQITSAAKNEQAYGFALNLKAPQSALNRSFDQVAMMSNLFPYDFATGRYDFERIRPIILSFKQLVVDGSTFPGIESLDIDPMRAQFAQGKIGMYMSADWEIGVYANQFTTDVNWAAAPIPTVTGSELGRSNINGAGKWLAISTQSKHPDLAWKVMEWFHRNEVLVKYHELGLGMSVVPSVLEIANDSSRQGSEFFKVDPTAEFVWPFAPHQIGLAIEGRTYYDVIAAVMFGAMDLDRGIQDLNRRYNDALDRAVSRGTIERIIIEDFDPANL